MTRVGWLLGVETVAIAFALTVALDLREHGRVAPLGGVNEWGYRGPVAHRRRPHEIRIAIIGGTRAFGWGEPGSVLGDEIRRTVMLTTDRPGGPARPVVAINLGRLGAEPASYPQTIEHYAYLRPDYICLYDDLGVRGGSPTAGTDGTSAVFELTGYAPALPLVFREKGMIWRFGDIQSGYSRPEHQGNGAVSFARREAGLMLEGAGATLDAVDRSMARLLRRGSADGGGSDALGYADEMMAAIAAAHNRARGVVLVLSPAERPTQLANRRALDGRMQLRTDAATAWLRVVDLGQDEGLATERALRLDGWNYATAGIALAASRIAPALLSLIASTR
jgi:hypothetical protein